MGAVLLGACLLLAVMMPRIRSSGANSGAGCEIGPGKYGARSRTDPFRVERNAAFWNKV